MNIRSLGTKYQYLLTPYYQISWHRISDLLAWDTLGYEYQITWRWIPGSLDSTLKVSLCTEHTISVAGCLVEVVWVGWAAHLFESLNTTVTEYSSENNALHSCTPSTHSPALNTLVLPSTHLYCPQHTCVALNTLVLPSTHLYCPQTHL